MSTDKPNYQLLEMAKAASITYLENADSLPVSPSKDALALLKDFDEDIPLITNDPIDTLTKLSIIGKDTVVNQGGSRYFGFVNGGILPIGIAARWLADTWTKMQHWK